MTVVKICGISEPGHARAAAALGADFVGIVFAPSRRQVTLGQGKRIAAALGKGRECPPIRATTEAVEAAIGSRRPLLVGVFADQDADTINDIAVECGLDLVQLSGSEPWEMLALLNRPALKCMKVRNGATATEVLAEAEEGARSTSSGQALVLLDPYVEGSYGGSGKTLDWQVVAQVAARLPVMLAGGLTPENVSEAVRTVRPWAVDVSSGVETEGVKDVAKIRSFIEAVKGASQGGG
ncbi:MAG TPA: phosphoribosylanthranilate isomerase [Dehalococcoidia bacterium]|nr:phosphoribosylanthranilate isomerase [Dehalococcoidia bacterium]